MTTPGEVDLLTHYMPIIVRAAGLSDWERKFCITACGQIKRGGWRPTDKQINIMRRLHDKFLAATSGHDDPLIERRHDGNN